MVGVVAVVPAYNEEKHIRTVVKDALKYVDNVVVVDDGSSDNTLEEAKGIKGIYSLRHVINLGKGAALKTGTEFAIERLKAKRIVFIDADMQHKPSDIPKFLEKLDEVDMVFGCRKFNNRMPLVFRFGNYALSAMIKLFFDVYVPDSQSGYRAFNARIYPKIKWRSQGYSVESEMIAMVGKHRIRYGIVSIATIYGNKYKGTTITDGVKILFDLIRWKID